MGVGHEDDQQELGHVKQLLEGTLHAANDPSVLLLDLLLLYLEVMKGRRDRTMNTREHLVDGEVRKPKPKPESKYQNHFIFVMTQCKSTLLL